MVNKDFQNQRKSEGLWTLPRRYFAYETVRLHLGQFAYCTLHLWSPQEYISSYSYGYRMNSDHAILVVHCITV